MVKLGLIILLFVSMPFFSLAQKGFYVNFTPGIDLLPRMPLWINQDEHEKLFLWADYETAPLKSPLYYSYRIGFIEEQKGWELELNHLKIYLKNTNGEIQRFSISHGYNQLFVNRVFSICNIGAKYGFGFVMAHPENTIRGKKLDERKGLFGWGYYLAGPALQCGVFKELKITGRFYVLAESKLSLAYANVPVSNGKAHAPVFAFHLQLGPGFYFIKKH